MWLSTGFWLALVVGFLGRALIAYYERWDMKRIEYPPGGTPHEARPYPGQEILATILLLLTAGFLLMAVASFLLALL